jgi:hypothetical protein
VLASIGCADDAAAARQIVAKQGRLKTDDMVIHRSMSLRHIGSAPACRHR